MEREPAVTSSTTTDPARRPFTSRSGRTLNFTALGFGSAPLGNLYRAISNERALQTLQAAWAEGIRYFDTAPLYGLGIAENCSQVFDVRALRLTALGRVRPVGTGAARMLDLGVGSAAANFVRGSVPGAEAPPSAVANALPAANAATTSLR